MKRKHLNALYLLIIATCYIYNNEAVQCDRYFGPSGGRYCIKMLGYSDYQWATCRTDSYSRAKSFGKYNCGSLSGTASYCFYQCMLEKYGYTGGSIYGSCRCSSGNNYKKILKSNSTVAGS